MERLTILPFAQAVEAAFRLGDPAVDAKTQEIENVRALEGLFVAFAKSDLSVFFASFAPEIEMEIFAPPEIPFLRHARGLVEVRMLVERNFAAVESQQPQLLSLVAQGDTVFLLAREHGKWRSSGKPYDFTFAQQFTFHSGKVTRFREVIAPTGTTLRKP